MGYRFWLRTKREEKELRVQVLCQCSNEGYSQRDPRLRGDDKKSCHPREGGDL